MSLTVPHAPRLHVAEMTRAYLAADPAYDGVFFTAVRTTGIFCLPSCRAKKPRPENVEFFATARQALFAGYRACRRCCPLRPPGAQPPWVVRLLREVEENPGTRIKDGDLRRAGVDPARARRHFQRHYGMTFQAYSRGVRLGAALRRIRAGAPLDDVVFSHGFDSHSGFRDAFSRTFGGPPGRGGADGVVAAWVETPLGPMVAGAVEEGVCLLEFTDRRMLEAQLETIQRRFARPVVPGDHPHLATLRGELERYFAGELREFRVPLVRPGTPFEEKVWDELVRIPYGETRSYAFLASLLGRKDAQRAVGRANGMNRIAIVVPCHRVVNKDGRLGGYGGGLWRKQWLLDLERGLRPLFPAGAPA